MGSAYDFSTTEERPFVTIDGEKYPLRLDLPWTEFLRMRERGTRLRSLSEQDERTEAEETELEELLREISTKTLEAPDEVIEKLTDMQKFQLWNVYAEEAKRLRGPTNGERSPDSDDSTEGASTAG